MVAWDGLNRRKFPRVSYPCLIKINATDETVLTHTENLGIGGVCVVIKKDVKPFAQVFIEVDMLDTGDHIKCAGRVVWNVRRKAIEEDKPLFYDIGIEFVDLPDEDRDRIDLVVKRLLKLGKGV